MKITRKTNILVSTRRKFVIRQPPSGEQKICEQCGELMTDAQSAAEIVGLSVREIYRLIEAGEIHFFENEEKICLICVESFGGKLVTRNSESEMPEILGYDAPDYQL